MRLRRVASTSWTLALVLSAVTGLTVAHLVARAAERAERLGGLRRVPVAARPLPAGRALAPADVSYRSLPAAALPDAALARSPAGRVARVSLAAGEVLLADRLAPGGGRGGEALLGPGERALAVPVAPGSLALRPGRRVDVLATFDVAGDDGGPPTVVVAAGAVVLHAGGEWATVAVPAGDAPRVAYAVARGTVTLALAPAG